MWSFLAIAQVPEVVSPEAVSGWEQAGIVAILIAAIIAFVYGLLTDKIVTGNRYAEAKQAREAAEGEIRALQKDFVRLTEDYRQLGRDVISARIVDVQRRGHYESERSQGEDRGEG